MADDETGRIAASLREGHIEAAKADAIAIARACNAKGSVDALDFETLCVMTAILYAARFK